MFDLMKQLAGLDANQFMSTVKAAHDAALAAHASMQRIEAKVDALTQHIAPTPEMLAALAHIAAANAAKTISNSEAKE